MTDQLNKIKFFMYFKTIIGMEIFLAPSFTFSIIPTVI